MKSRPFEDVFFFARRDAGYYDSTVDLAAPHYRMMHDVTVETVRLHLASRRDASPPNLLDIGSGTGVSTVALLEAHPEAHVVAIDFSAEVNAILREKLAARFGHESPTDRWQVVELDVLDSSFTAESARACCRPGSGHQRYAAIVSVLTLHHFNAADKERIHEILHGALEPGGIFVYADFFDFSREPNETGYWQQLSNHAEEVTIRWIEKGFDRVEPGDLAWSVPEAERQRLKSQWIDHVRNAHDLSSIGSQEAILRKVGFVAVECPFRFWQSAVLCARKGGV